MQFHLLLSLTFVLSITFLYHVSYTKPTSAVVPSYFNRSVSLSFLLTISVVTSLLRRYRYTSLLTPLYFPFLYLTFYFHLVFFLPPNSCFPQNYSYLSPFTNLFLIRFTFFLYTRILYYFFHLPLFTSRLSFRTLTLLTAPHLSYLKKIE